MEVEEIKMFIKDTSLVNPKLIALVTDTSTKLMEQDLSDSNRLNLVIDTLKITCQNFNYLASKTKISFTEKDRQLFHQNLMILTLILRTAFTLEWFRKKTVTVIDWSNGFNHNKHVWTTLLYKSIRVLILDLGAELTVMYEQLNIILVKEPSDWIFYIHMVSRAHDYFKFQVSQIENIINTGLEKPIDEHEVYREYNSSQYTKKVLQINQLRRETLISFYKKTCEARFEHKFFLLTGELLDWERFENIRNLADLSPLAHESELDLNLL